MREKLKNKNVRRILRHGGSYAITIPMEVMLELGWKEKQKVVVKKKDRSVVIVDWK